MATIIDALVVTLGLDGSGVKKGAAGVNKSLKETGEESEKTARKVQHSSKTMGEGFRSVKVEIMGMLAALGVAVSAKGIAGFFTHLTEGNAALGRFAANVNMTAARVKAMGTLAEEFGGKNTDALNAIQTVANGVAEAIRTGSSAYTNYARNIGAQLQDSKGHWLSYEQQLSSIGKRLRAIAKSNPMGREQAYEYAQQMGLGGFFNELMDPNFTKDINEAQRATGVSPQTIAEAERLQKQWALIRAQFNGFWDQLYTAVGPTLIKLSQELLKWLQSIDFKHLAEEAQQFVESIDWKGLLQNLKDIATTGKEWIKDVGGWKPILIALGVVIGASLLSPLLAVVGALGAIPAAAALAFAAIKGVQEANERHGFTDKDLAADPTKDSPELHAYREAVAHARFVRNGGTNNPDLSTESDWLAPGSGAMFVKGNNPGNIMKTNPDGSQSLVQYSSKAEGLAAQYMLLRRYMLNKKLTTLRSIINTYAPQFDKKGKQINNTPQYISNVAAWTHLNPDQQLTVDNIPDLMRAMNRQEGNNHSLSYEDYKAAFKALNTRGYGIPTAQPGQWVPDLGATAYTVPDSVALAGYGATVATTPQAGVPRAPVAATGAATGAPQFHIESVTVNTRATDAAGIARDMANKVSNTRAITLAATGVE